MNFAQFTNRRGLRDIKTTLDLCSQDLYRSGLKIMPKSTLAEANEKKDWRIYQDFGYVLIQKAKKLYKGEKLRIGLKPSLHTISNSIGQILFKRGDIRDFYNKPDGPVNVPEDDSNRLLTLW